MRNRRALILAGGIFIVFSGILPRLRQLSENQYPDNESYYRSAMIVTLEIALLLIAVFREDIDHAVPHFARFFQFRFLIENAANVQEPAVRQAALD